LKLNNFSIIKFFQFKYNIKLKIKNFLEKIYYIYILNYKINSLYFKIISFFLFFKKKIHFISIPRTGSTLLRASIKSFNNIDNLHIIHNSHFVKTNVFLKNYVISIREPVDRFISLFYHYKLNQKIGYYQKYLDQFDSVDDFIDTLEDKKTKKFLTSSHHFKENLETFITKEFLLKNPPRFIFLFDDIKNDFTKYVSTLDKNINLNEIDQFFMIKFGETRTRRSKEERNLNLRNISKLKNYLKNEYILYNYLLDIRKKINKQFLRLNKKNPIG
jgi:adenylate kinase family enzyme